MSGWLVVMQTNLYYSTFRCCCYSSVNIMTLLELTPSPRFPLGLTIAFLRLGTLQCQTRA